MEKEHHGFLWGLLAALTSSCMAIFTKLAVDIPVETMIFFRFALGYPIFIWIIYQKKIEISWNKIPKHLIRGLAGLAALYAYFYAIKLIPLVNASTLVNTSALFMPLIALIWLKLLVSKKRFFAVILGFIGVLILLHPTTEIFAMGSILGLLSGLLGAIALMGVRQLSKTETTETILSYYFLINTAVSFIPFALTFKPIGTPLHWLYLFLIGAFALLFQYSLTKAYTHAPATKVSTLNYLSVLFSGLAGWWIFHEEPNLFALLGIALILTSALLALLDKSTPRPL